MSHLESNDTATAAACAAQQHRTAPPTLQHTTLQHTTLQHTTLQHKRASGTPAQQASLHPPAPGTPTPSTLAVCRCSPPVQQTERKVDVMRHRATGVNLRRSASTGDRAWSSASRQALRGGLAP
ncbi:MAG: hypothetical protein WDW36_005444 [Sanguina aurantia]